MLGFNREIYQGFAPVLPDYCTATLSTPSFPGLQPELLRMQKLKRKYPAYEYITLVLDEPRVEGTPGIVYPATHPRSESQAAIG